MLSHLAHSILMTPWEVIEGALARRKPVRDQAWLAEQLQVSAQAVTNWKTRGVPPGQYEALADLFGLTVDQVTGRAPVPWESAAEPWPFPDTGLLRQIELLDAVQRLELQGVLRQAVSRYEAHRVSPPTFEQMPVALPRAKPRRKTQM